MFAESLQIIRQESGYLPEIRCREPIILSQFRWAAGTVQVEHSLMFGADHMNMCGPMVVGIDHHAEAIEAQNRDHAATPAIT
jgi:hypothetical protein